MSNRILTKATLPKWVKPLPETATQFSIFHGAGDFVGEYVFTIDRWQKTVEYRTMRAHEPRRVATVSNATWGGLAPEVLVAAGVEGARRLAETPAAQPSLADRGTVFRFCGKLILVEERTEGWAIALHGAVALRKDGSFNERGRPLSLSRDEAVARAEAIERCWLKKKTAKVKGVCKDCGLVGCTAGVK